MEKRTDRQNRSLHKGCQEIADTLVEHGISLSVALKNLDVRPSMETIKDIYRDIAKAKYNVTSTAQLERKQINEVWEDLTKTLSENTGIQFNFPSEENTEEYLNSYDNKT